MIKIKIGKFAKKFATRKSTIRYYAEINLLIPSYEGTYPEYGHTCIRDMEDIIMYQNLGFTNKEISEIKKIERYYVSKNQQHKEHLEGIFAKKIENHKQEIDYLHESIQEIELIMNNENSQKIKNKLGVSFESLNYLSCPYCSDSYDVKDAEINNSMIIRGTLLCSCGEKYKILDGIIMPKELDYDISKLKIAHNADFNNSHFSLLSNAGDLMIKEMKSWDINRGIVFTNCDADFLMTNIYKGFENPGHYFLTTESIRAAYQIMYVLKEIEFKGRITIIILDDKLPLSSKIPYLIDYDSNIIDYKKKRKLGDTIKYINHGKVESMISLYTRKMKEIKSENSRYLDEKLIEESYVNLGYIKNEEIVVGSFSGINMFETMLGQDAECELCYKKFTKKVIDYK